MLKELSKGYNMNNYCLKYPTCPVCHEPHNKGFVLKKVDYKEAFESSGSKNKFYCRKEMEKYGNLTSNLVNICLYKCSKCGTYFRNHLDFSGYDKINKYTGSEEKNYPFYWNISLNPIEESYINWIPNIVKGNNYCIYWPWEEVKFLPIFISEYNSSFKNEKIVMIDKFHKSSNYIIKPDTYNYLKNLYRYDTVNEFTEDLKIELKPFKNKVKQHLLFKNDFIHYHVKYLPKENKFNEDFSEDYKDYPEKISTTVIRKKFEDYYGKGTVKKIYLENSNKGGTYKTKNPLFEIKATYEVQWGGNPKINMVDYWKILANYGSLNNITLNYNEYNKDIKIINDNIFILNHYSKTLFEDINSINPDILIIKDSEDIFLNYQNSIRTALINYINSNSNLTTISFSTDKNKRFRYNYMANNIFNHSIIHSWDNDEILNQLNFHNTYLLSSNLSDIKKVEDLDIVYEEIYELKCIDDISQQIIDKFDDYAKTFFRFLIQTPIQIMENTLDYNDNYNFTFKGRDLGFWFEKIYNLNDEKLLDEAINSFGKTYKNEEKPINPLIDKIKEIIQDNLNKYSKIILVIPSNYYKKTMKHIFINESNEDKLILSIWNEIDVSISENVLLISTISPYDSFDLYKHNIKRYIFVGSPNSILHIKDIVMKKTSCDITRPLINLVGENYAPPLLYECLMNIKDIEDKVNLQNTILKTEEIIIKKHAENKEEISWIDTAEKERKDRILHKNQNVILLLNEYGEGIFIPKKNSLTYKKDNSSLAVFDFNNKKNSKEKLIGKEVIIDNNGFYRSYKEFFIKFMVESYTTNLTDFPQDSINNFKELNEKTYSWLNILHDLLNSINKKNMNDSILKTKKELAKIIKSYITTNYTLESIINSWLSEPEVIGTAEGTINIYPIEHPQNVTSLIELYEGLSNDYDMDLSEKDAIKTYQSGIYLQKIRRSFLKNEKIPIAYIHLYNPFKKYLNQIISMSKIFTVDTIQDVKLKEDVKSYKIIKDYENYM